MPPRSKIKRYPEGFKRGRWAGLTVNTVSLMLRCDRNKAAILLKLKQDRVHRPLTLADIGDLIIAFRLERDWKDD